MNALYSKKVAREILEESGALGRCVVVKKKGVFPAVARDKLMPEESKLLRWRPARVMTRPKGSPSVNDTPMLPPEFSGRELAAFMLAGAGAMVAVFFGNWEDGPDHASLERLDEDSGARQAVVDAFDAYREAVGKVGKRELELDRRARESCTAYSNARSEALLQHRVSEAPQPQPGDSDTRRRELDAEYQRRLALVEGDVSALEAEMNRLQAEDKAAEQKWLHAMVAELLKPDTGPAGHGAESAPQAVPVEQQEAIDFGMLATPEQLIDTFGNHTGMCKAWFSNLTDTPRLLIARKVAGTGGKHHTPPLFCPFEVMQWLIDEKRKKGRKVSQEKAWQLLQCGFEKVYNARSAGDPR